MACICLSTLSYHVVPASWHYIRGFGTVLSPDHYRRPSSRWVSYYALFKWWLLLSQHPRCHRTRTSLRTEYGLGTLADDLGCSPFDHEAYPPQSYSRDSHCGIRSLVEGGIRAGPSSHSVALPPQCSCPEASPKAISERTRYLHV